MTPKVSVIGTGYVGLVTGTCLASQGVDVICADVDHDKITELQCGRIPIYEPGLETLVIQSVHRGTLSFTSDVPAAIATSDIVMIAVGTPSSDDGSTDLTAVSAVADLIGRTIDEPTTIVIKSTVPVGTADMIRERVKRQTRTPFSVISNPEFLREGKAVTDFLEAERVVIGVESSNEEADQLRRIYERFIPAERIMVIDSRSAELSKYASNAFLATKLSFINEIAEMAEATGADIELVRSVMGQDPRIGPGHLAPGLGYGGSCFPKDVSSLLYEAQDRSVPLRVLQGVHEANKAQPERLIQKMREHFRGDLAGRRIAVWGLAFKPDTDDVREAPALKLVDLLVEGRAYVTAYDPSATANARGAACGSIAFASTPYECVRGAEALVIATEWDLFKTPDWDSLRFEMATRVIFDGRNVFSPSAVAEEGFTYYSIGRPLAEQPINVASEMVGAYKG